MSTCVKVLRNPTSKFWTISDFFDARVEVVPESEVPKEWQEWMGERHRMFCIGEWIRSREHWNLTARTHDRKW